MCIRVRASNGGLSGYIGNRFYEVPWAAEALKTLGLSREGDELKAILDRIVALDASQEPSYLVIQDVLKQGQPGTGLLEQKIWKTDWTRVRFEHAVRNREVFFRK